MNPTKLSASILQKIQDDSVIQKPKWNFVLKNTIFWVVFVLSIFLGGKSIGIIIESLTSVDHEVLRNLGFNGPMILWLMLPTVWVLSMLAFVGLAVWGAHHTSRGYKIPVVSLLLLNLIGSGILGVVSYTTHASQQVDEFLSHKVGMYKGVEGRMDRIMNKPPKNSIAGTVLTIDKENKSLTIEDLKYKEIWMVDYANMRDETMAQNIEVGTRIMLRGRPDKENKAFDAMHMVPADEMRKARYKKRPPQRMQEQRPEEDRPAKGERMPPRRN